MRILRSALAPAQSDQAQSLHCLNEAKLKKIPVFRVTGPELNLLVKPRFFFQVVWEKYYFMHFERQKAFQNASNNIFSRKKIIKKNVRLLYLNFSDPLPETHLFFHLT